MVCGLGTQLLANNALAVSTLSSQYPFKFDIILPTLARIQLTLDVKVVGFFSDCAHHLAFVQCLNTRLAQSLL